MYNYCPIIYKKKTYKTYNSAVGDKYIRSIQFRILILLIISGSWETCREPTNTLWFYSLRYDITRGGQCVVIFFYMGHRSNTIDRRSGNRCWDSELGSLINDEDWVITPMWSICTRSNISILNNLSARNCWASGNEWPGITVLVIIVNVEVPGSPGFETGALVERYKCFGFLNFWKKTFILLSAQLLVWAQWMTWERML